MKKKILISRICSSSFKGPLGIREKKPERVSCDYVADHFFVEFFRMQVVDSHIHVVKFSIQNEWIFGEHFPHFVWVHAGICQETDNRFDVCVKVFPHQPAVNVRLVVPFVNLYTQLRIN